MDTKYLAVSCLQKSIRQGHAELAQTYAGALWEQERGYLCYRLSIIAGEDIGIANWPLIAPVLATAMRKKELEALGGKEFMMDWVSKLAASPKDRTACDWPYMATYLDGSSLPNSADVAMTLNAAKPTPVQPLILWSWLGQKPCKHEGLVGLNTENPVKFWEWHNTLNLPAGALESIKACATYQREPIFMGLGLCERARQRELMVNGTLPEPAYVSKVRAPVMLGPWLLSGFDKHTQEGKKLLRGWLQTNPEWQQVLRKHQVPWNDQENLLGRTLFQADGGQVNHRLIYPTAIHIYKTIQNNWLPEAAKELRQLWNRDWAKWQSWASQQQHLAPVLTTNTPLPTSRGSKPN